MIGWFSPINFDSSLIEINDWLRLVNAFCIWCQLYADLSAIKIWLVLVQPALNVKSKGLQLIWDDDLVPIFCEALVETDQQHVSHLVGYEGLHTFVMEFIALSQGFFTCVCGDVNLLLCNDVVFWSQKTYSYCHKTAIVDGNCFRIVSCDINFNWSLDSADTINMSPEESADLCYKHYISIAKQYMHYAYYAMLSWKLVESA